MSSYVHVCILYTFVPSVCVCEASLYILYLKVTRILYIFCRVFTAFIALHIHRRLAHPVVSTTVQVQQQHSHGV